MNKQDYIFCQYINLYIENVYLDKLIEKYEKGVGMMERKTIQDFVKEQDPPDNPEGLMFMYIIFKRTRPNSYIDQLGKSLAEHVSNFSNKELEQLHKDLKEFLTTFGIDELVINKQVISNIKHYQKYLRK
jgi:hypothetical protein